MPHNCTAEMPEISAYSMTVGPQALLSSAGPMWDENPNELTYIFGNQAQVEVWPDVDQETKKEFQQQYDKEMADIADKLTQRLYSDEEEGMKKRALRVVQVFIADRHPDIPLESAIVYQSPEPFATDMTNQELYFTIPIMDLLAEHNDLRIRWPDKQATKTAGKPIMLEEIRISELDMQVTAFTEFT